MSRRFVSGFFSGSLVNISPRFFQALSPEFFSSFFQDFCGKFARNYKINAFEIPQKNHRFLSKYSFLWELVQDSIRNYSRDFFFGIITLLIRTSSRVFPWNYSEIVSHANLHQISADFSQDFPLNLFR